MSHSSTSALHDFQNNFARALLAPETSVSPLAALTAQPGFAVYRNTVRKACIDALQANYPAIERLVGEEWMRAAAAIYARTEPPSHPTLLDYGAGFAQFLRTFAPAAELPYLAGVAQLDRFWSEAHIARDEPPLQPATLSALDFERVILRPHAAARWAWFDDAPIFTIWQRNRDATFDHAAAPDVTWLGEGALITRPYGVVQSAMLDAGGCALLGACAAGVPLAQAAQVASSIDDQVDLSQLMATLLTAGALVESRGDCK